MDKKSKRGKLLTFLIVLAFATSLYGLYTILFKDTASLNPYLPSWYNWYLLIWEFIYLMGLIAVWFWKKVGVYVIIVMEMVGIIQFTLVPKINLIPNTETILAFITALVYLVSFIFIVLFVIAVKRKWSYFK